MDKLAIEISKILVERLQDNRNEPLIQYGELAKKLPFAINPRNLDNPLGTLSDICKEYNMPLISTIVVNKESYRPGAGYFKYFFPGRPEKDWDKIFLEQLKQVKNYKNWGSFLDLVSNY